MTEAPGQIIVLNGTSSSGKSSIARVLLPMLSRAFYYLPVDSFNSMRHQRPMSPSELEEVLSRLASGFHQSVAGMAAAGNNVVVDHVIRKQSWVLECLRHFPDDVVLVGVHCPLEELNRREVERGDRELGKAAAQFPLVHKYFSYDISVDTSENSPADCASLIANAAESIPSSERAIAKLREHYGVSRETRSG